MTTKTAGGNIPPRVGLTLEANYAAAIGDPVMIGAADFQVLLADGTKPVIGHVSKRNVGRGTLAGGNAGMYPVSVVPGDVTVEAYGHGVQPYVAGEAIVRGTKVGIGVDNKLHPAGVGVANVGVALMSATTGNSVDVLLQGA